MKKTLQAIIFITQISVLSSCISQENVTGNMLEDSEIKGLSKGVSQNQVEATLGTPTAKSDFPPYKWYYISDTYNKRSLSKPKIINRKVLEIGFDEHQNISEIKKYGLENSNDVEFASQYTKTRGNQRGVVSEFVGNIGRFKKGDVHHKPSPQENPF